MPSHLRTPFEASIFVQYNFNLLPSSTVYNNQIPQLFSPAVAVGPCDPQRSHLAESPAGVHAIHTSIKEVAVATTARVSHWAAHVQELVVVVFGLRTGTESAVFHLQTPAETIKRGISCLYIGISPKFEHWV